MINSFLHIGISVFDLEKSVKFYTDVMGMEIDYEAYHKGAAVSKVVGVKNAELRVKVVKKGPAKLELIDYGNKKRKLQERSKYKEQDSPGLIHIAFLVDDVDKEYKRIKALGYKFNSKPMVTRPNGPRVAYFLGPDNVVIELYQKPHQ